MPMIIVIEHHPSGDLGSYLQKKGCLSPSKVLRFALDIARGTKNILLDNGGLLKIARFGLIRLSNISPDKAKSLQPEVVDRASTYIALEIYNDKIFDRSVDVYSFGVYFMS
ncbi:hypothetical protein P3L10_003721 [Capsicum annuum]